MSVATWIGLVSIVGWLLLPILAMKIYLDWGERILQIMGKRGLIVFSTTTTLVSFKLMDYIAKFPPKHELRPLTAPLLMVVMISFMTTTGAVLSFLPKKE